MIDEAINSSPEIHDAVVPTLVMRGISKHYAGVAALLAHAACKGAAYNVRVNVQALDDKSKGENLAREAQKLVMEANDLVAKVSETVERAPSV